MCVCCVCVREGERECVCARARARGVRARACLCECKCVCQCVSVCQCEETGVYYSSTLILLVPVLLVLFILIALDSRCIDCILQLDYVASCAVTECAVSVLAVHRSPASGNNRFTFNRSFDWLSNAFSWS